MLGLMAESEAAAVVCAYLSVIVLMMGGIHPVVLLVHGAQLVRHWLD